MLIICLNNMTDTSKSRLKARETRYIIKYNFPIILNSSTIKLFKCKYFNYVNEVEVTVIFKICVHINKGNLHKNNEVE